MNNIPEIEFNSVYERYYNPLLSFSKRIVYCDETSQDVVQETFSRLYKQDFLKISDHISQWLFVVCRNLSLKALKKQKRYVPLLDNESDSISEDNDPRQELDLCEQKIALKKCVNKLTPKQKKVIELRFFKHFSNTEISKKMKITTSCVAFHICVASQSLKQMMLKEIER